jgi:hypothetical protein
MDIGARIDQLYALRQGRLELQKRVDAMKGEEAEARTEIIELLDSLQLVKASGFHATCGIKTDIEPFVDNWLEVFDFVKNTDRFDLLQKRLSVLSWRELNNEGTLVPGTSVITVRDLSLTKSTR